MLQVNFDPFPVLHTQRLVLRQTTHADAPQLYFLRSNDDVMRYIGRPRPASIDDIITLIDKIRGNITTNEGIEWCICRPGDDTYIGSISYHKITKDQYSADVGYLLHPDFQKQGILSEAMAAVLDYGFRELGVHFVDAEVHRDNVRSRALLERFRFVQAAELEDGYLRYTLQSPFVTG